MKIYLKQYAGNNAENPSVKSINERLKAWLNSTAFLAFLTVAMRCLPHWPNMLPLMSLGVVSSRFFPLRVLLPALFLGLLISNGILSAFTFPILFSSWALTLYSGYLLCALFARFILQKHASTFLFSWIFTLGLSTFYWILSNAMVWMLSGHYSHDVTGLMTCYTLAIPFLAYSWLGDLVWFPIMYAVSNANSAFAFRRPAA